MNWLKQTKDKPLFPDVLWSRPENKRHAGKLLIIGGHQQSFSAVSEAYSAALKAGIGTAKVVLPNKLEKTLRSLFPEAEFAASTPIGSFSRQALGQLLDLADWADAVLLAGDFGRNSESAVLLESFIEKYSGKLALAGDSLDYFLAQPTKLINRPNTLIVGNLNQLQKLATPSLIQQNADLVKVLEQLGTWSGNTPAAVLTVHANQVIVAYQQQISTTLVKFDQPNTDLTAYATVWWLQQPEKTFEAITSATCCYLSS
jgi:NAD(P)H-hydrate repair Nnr-like enzyme with NAD(P)H-hydrate dehydratase domain